MTTQTGIVCAICGPTAGTLTLQADFDTHMATNPTHWAVTAYWVA